MTRHIIRHNYKKVVGVGRLKIPHDQEITLFPAIFIGLSSNYKTNRILRLKVKVYSPDL